MNENTTYQRKVVTKNACNRKEISQISNHCTSRKYKDINKLNSNLVQGNK
jgi:hypothetical protein